MSADQKWPSASKRALIVTVGNAHPGHPRTADDGSPETGSLNASDRLGVVKLRFVAFIHDLRHRLGQPVVVTSLQIDDYCRARSNGQLQPAIPPKFQ